MKQLFIDLIAYTAAGLAAVIFRLPDYVVYTMLRGVYAIARLTGAVDDKPNPLFDLIEVYRMGPEYWHIYKNMMVEGRFDQIRYFIRGMLSGHNEV
jgi:hypothetical protein